MNFETNSGYANPLVYVAFKQLVALDGKGGDSIAISLLNSLVPDFQSNPLQSLESATLDIPIIVDHGMRPLQMDFHAVNSCGEHLILELQLRRHIFFDERILFYATRTYSHQIDNQTLATGSWYKKLKKTYAIQILDYDSNKIIGISDPEVEDSLKERIAKHPMKTGNFIKHYIMTDRFSGQEIDHLQIIQVELPRAESLDLFPPDKNFTEQRWWLSILNHSKEYTEEYIEKLYKEEIMPNTIYEGLGRIKLDKWNPNLLQDYNREVAEIREFYAPQIAMDMKDAEERGIAIGEERGIAIGEERGKRETALSMLADGMSVATVSKYTGLSTKELEQLKAQ